MSIGVLAARSLGWLGPLAAGWWVVSEGRPGSWGVGIPTVAVAALVAAAVVPLPDRWPRPSALPRFLLAFLAGSLRGGVDVSRRVLSPSLPIDPGLATFRLRLPEGAPRVLLADVLSLLPGTVTVDLDGDRLVVHGLDRGPSLEAGVRELEHRVADLFGLPLPPGEAP